jgi:hypothetical protein
MDQSEIFLFGVTYNILGWHGYPNYLNMVFYACVCFLEEVVRVTAIVKNLQPEFEPVSVVWSNTIPDDALQLSKGKFGCILYLFAEAARRAKVAGGNRETITCNGGRAALGLGVDFATSDDLLDRNVAVFSKGLKSAGNQKAYQSRMEAASKNCRDLFKNGERRHCNAKLAKDWILHGSPRYDIP